MKRKWIKVIISSSVFILVVIAVSILYFQTNNFISDDEKSINTDIVITYTVFGDKGNQKVYIQGDKEFNEISDILSSAEITHNKKDIFLYENTDERIVLKSKFKEQAYYSYYRDGKYILILKNFCKNKDTSYFLDNHDYLITEISKKDYEKIFK